MPLSPRLGPHLTHLCAHQSEVQKPVSFKVGNDLGCGEKTAAEADSGKAGGRQEHIEERNLVCLVRASQAASPSSNHTTGHRSANNTFSISYNLKLAPSPWEPPEGFMNQFPDVRLLGWGFSSLLSPLWHPDLPKTHCGKLWLSFGCLPGSSRQPVIPPLPRSSGPDSSV